MCSTTRGAIAMAEKATRNPSPELVSDAEELEKIASGLGATPPPTPAGATASQDPFDNLEQIRSPQNHTVTGATRELLLHVRNTFAPKDGAFFRVHPSPGYQLEAGLLIPPHGKHFLLTGVMREYGKQLPTYRPVTIFTAQDRDNDIFLWMVKRAKDGQEPMAWHETGMDGAIIAQTKWVQRIVDMKNGRYVFNEMLCQLPDPQWPDVKFIELLRVSFKNSVISNVDDIEVLKLEGKA
jgi:hypothetical protein